MPQYLISVHRPDNYDHSALDGAARHNIDMLNDEMSAAGVRVFVGGLRPPKSVQCVRLLENGNILITQGSYLVAGEYIDGFWVLNCSTMEEAMTWARKAALACRASIEVRPFY